MSGSADPANGSYQPRPGLTHADADWSGLQVLVAGLGVSGFAAADALAERGAQVRVVAPVADAATQERATVLDVLGVQVLIGPKHMLGPPDGTELVVTSPGLSPRDPLLVAAAAAGVPVWGEVELAWRMRARVGPAPWLTVTGTNGKSTTVNLLASMLRAGGLRATSAGNVGLPILSAVLDPQPYDVLAVELSSFQLHWQRSVSPAASCCLNIAPDHLDWHGSYEEYVRAKGLVYQRTKIACVYNVQDPATEQLVRDAEVVEGCRAVGFTTGVPGRSMVGVVEDVLADRAFVAERASSAAELGTFADLRGGAAVPPHYLANALAAAALARAYGVAPAAVRDGLRSFTLDPHRGQQVAAIDGVAFVDDSKATNPAAAAAALRAYDHVVWVAGGQLKGADVESLVRDAAGRLRAAVLLGQDRELIAAALARHAPEVPVVGVDNAETDAMSVMDLVVHHALALAQPGDVVLLAPAAASKDMFASYADRGDAFADAVHRRARRGPGPA